MTRQLDGLRWKPAWVSHLGCLAGCAEYLGLNISRPWLYGATGHAFLINIHPEVCPSGPTCFKSEFISQGARNAGLRVARGVVAHKSQPDFAARQEEAWKYVRGCIDRGVPCYAWEMKVPEWYVVYGYDGGGYYYSGAGCDNGEGPKPWRDYGNSDIGVVNVLSVEKGIPAADAKTVKHALAFALEASENPNPWCFADRGYRMGPAGYDLWAAALESGAAGRFGQGYNAAAWRECREMAVRFLREARGRLAGKADAAFDEAAGHYDAARDALAALAEKFPFAVGDRSARLKSPEGASLVRQAAAAERKGLEAIRKIAAAL
jgi:hypothetical protein